MAGKFELVVVESRNALHLLFLQLFKAQEVLLSVTADLRARPGHDVVFNQAPVLPEQLHTLDEALVFDFGPAAVLVEVVALGRRVLTNAEAARHVGFGEVPLQTGAGGGAIMLRRACVGEGRRTVEVGGAACCGIQSLS